MTTRLPSELQEIDASRRHCLGYWDSLRFFDFSIICDAKSRVKLPKRQLFRAEGKKIKDALNMLIQVLEESRCIWDIF